MQADERMHADDRLLNLFIGYSLLYDVVQQMFMSLVPASFCFPSTHVLIKARMHWAAFCSVSSPAFFLMLNPPRKSPEGFELLGRVNKDVTIAHAALLNEYRRFDVGILRHPKERASFQVYFLFPLHSLPWHSCLHCQLLSACFI